MNTPGACVRASKIGAEPSRTRNGQGRPLAQTPQSMHGSMGMERSLKTSQARPESERAWAKARAAASEFPPGLGLAAITAQGRSAKLMPEASAIRGRRAELVEGAGKDGQDIPARLIGAHLPGRLQVQGVLQLTHGVLAYQGLHDIGPTETEVPTYLQSDPSALAGEIDEQLLFFHDPDSLILIPC